MLDIFQEKPIIVYRVRQDCERFFCHRAQEQSNIGSVKRAANVQTAQFLPD